MKVLADTSVFRSVCISIVLTVKKDKVFYNYD